MPEQPQDATPPETPAERRRRLERIFGDVLPDTTSDERDPEGGDRSEDASEAWLKAQVPPHHG
ncbi:MAG: hypothetical protein WB767_05935 [Nocardioides sp.]